jgi:hypothetical protein
VKRFAWLALALVVTYLGAALADRCDDAAGGDCPPACHFSCVDGCAVAPVAVAPTAIAVAVRSETVPAEAGRALLDLDLPPDPIPPRA